MNTFKMKKRTPLLIALSLVMLFAMATSAFAFDDTEMECMPRPEPPKFMHCMPAPRECIYYQDLYEEEGFQEYRGYNEDFGWQHAFPFYNFPGMTVLSATLRVTAWDVDQSSGEVDMVYADGVELGALEGGSGITTITEFEVPVELITDDGLLDVWLDIDQVYQGAWLVTVEASELEVICQCGRFRWRRIIICD